MILSTPGVVRKTVFSFQKFNDLGIVHQGDWGKNSFLQWDYRLYGSGRHGLIAINIGDVGREANVA